MAWRHQCSVRIEFRQGKFFDSKYKELSKKADNPIGNYVEVYMSKNKTCPPNRHNGFFTLRYDIGVDYIHDLVETCIEFGLINKRGAWFDILDPNTGEVLVQSLQGQQKVVDFLENEENIKVLQALEDMLDEKIKDMG